MEENESKVNEKGSLPTYNVKKDEAQNLYICFLFPLGF
jgi:hypothetical protein